MTVVSKFKNKLDVNRNQHNSQDLKIEEFALLKSSLNVIESTGKIYGLL